MKYYFGNSLKIYRIAHKMKQEDFSELSGISKSMIGMLENNKRNASSEVEFRIKKILDISLDKDLQKKLLENFQRYLIEEFNYIEEKYGFDKLKNVLDETQIWVKNYNKLLAQYYGRLQDKNDFFEIYEMRSFEEFEFCKATEYFYKENKELKEFYKTYTEFILDNVDNIVEILQNYVFKEENMQYVTIFKDKIPNNIKNDFEKIMNSINSTTYADYTTYQMSFNLSGNAFGYTITDDSMTPKYEIGNIAVIKLTEIFENGKDYLIKIDKNFIIRRIQIENEKILLKPLNYNYDVICIDKENIEIIGKVIDIKLN